MSETYLKGGVLIIGSLLWENDLIRKKWRQDFLEEKNKIETKAPIRYGRISNSRNFTFTMIFSNDCNEKKLLGNAFFLPFKKNPVDIKEIQKNAFELIKSEHKKKQINFNRFHWSWGALALVVNPKSLIEKKEQINHLLNFWLKQYDESFDPMEYKVNKETPVINKQGILLFDWTNELKDFDFVITTVTKPNVNQYPTAKTIADKILTNEYSTYFENNLREGISTFQDADIKTLIQDKKLNL